MHFDMTSGYIDMINCLPFSIALSLSLCISLAIRIRFEATSCTVARCNWRYDVDDYTVNFIRGNFAHHFN